MAQLISGFDYRIQSPVQKTKKQWKALAKSIISEGGRCRTGRQCPASGETFLTVPMTEDLGAPFFKRTTQVLAVEIYAKVQP